MLCLLFLRRGIYFNVSLAFITHLITWGFRICALYFFLLFLCSLIVIYYFFRELWNFQLAEGFWIQSVIVLKHQNRWDYLKKMVLYAQKNHLKLCKIEELEQKLLSQGMNLGFLWNKAQGWETALGCKWRMSLNILLKNYNLVLVRSNWARGSLITLRL